MHPAERYVGIPYDAKAFDCADFVAYVRRKLHWHRVALPNGRPRGAEGQAVLGELSKQYADETDDPQDGDLVLMKRKAGAGHVGLFYKIGGEDWVLHSNETNGMSVLHRVRDLPLWGARITGFYRFRLSLMELFAAAVADAVAADGKTASAMRRRFGLR